MGIDKVEQRFLAAVQVYAPDSHGDHLRAAGLNGPRGLLAGFVLAGSNNQPRPEFTACNDEGIHEIYCNETAKTEETGRRRLAEISKITQLPEYSINQFIKRAGFRVEWRMV